MKILVANKFWYPRGGSEIVALGTASLLKEAEHDVRSFAMANPDNVDSLTYAASQVDFGGGMTAKLRSAARVLGIDSLRGRFREVLKDFRPDVVHLHNIHSYLSPVLAEEAHRAGARVVWTLHDCKLLCPSYLMLRQGRVCEECIGANKSGVIRHRCMKGSMAASLLAWAEAMKWHRTRIESSVDAFISPSAFIADKMIQGGYNPAKMHVLTNMIQPPKYKMLQSRASSPRAPYYCYVGRLSDEKGLRTLIKAASAFDMELRIAGSGPIEDELRRAAAPHPHIHFLGRLDSAAVVDLLTGAQFSVITSECYENNPLGVIESLCAGTPVAGADIGGIPELISPASGLTFRPGDSAQLAATLRSMRDTAFDSACIAAEARARFAPERHLEQLLKIYRGVEDARG